MRIMKYRSKNNPILALSYIFYFFLFILFLEFPFLHSVLNNNFYTGITSDYSSSGLAGTYDPGFGRDLDGSHKNVRHLHKNPFPASQFCFLCKFGSSFVFSGISSSSCELYPRISKGQFLGNLPLTSSIVLFLPLLRAPPAAV